jgi:hypothetical protein
MVANKVIAEEEATLMYQTSLKGWEPAQPK